MTEETIAAYNAYAKEYREGTQHVPASVWQMLDEFVTAVGVGARVLEIGSGGGRDAAYLESKGLHIRRTDVSSSFVELLREQGHVADVLDPLTDDLADHDHRGEPYDAVWANACLLHVQRTDLPIVLDRLREAVRPGGVLRFSVKEGDGEAVSTHGAVGAPRRFVYWREPELGSVVEQAGWSAVQISRIPGDRGEHWLEAWGRR